MKTIIYVVGAIAIVATALKVSFDRGPGSLTSRFPEARETMASASNNAKKALIIYQPNGTKTAYKVAKNMGEKVRDAGYDVELNRPGSYLPKDLSAYSFVAFGSPVYAGQTSTVLVEYMKSVTNLPKKNVVIFSVGGMDTKEELDTLREALAKDQNCVSLKFKAGAESENESKYDDVYRMAKN